MSLGLASYHSAESPRTEEPLESSAIGQAEPHVEDYGSLARTELRYSTVRWASIAVALLGVGLLLFAMSVYDPVEPRMFVTILSLVLVGALAYLAVQLRVAIAAAVLVSGILISAVLAIGVWSAGLVMPWASLAVLAAAALLGRYWGAVTAAVVMVGIGALASEPTWAIPGDLAIGAILLCWAGFLLYSAVSGPSHTLLDWAWSSYVQALRHTEEARERQAGLVRLTRGLAEYSHQIEQLNLELEHARRSADKARELKAQFAASVSHELRTPLNLIIGFCEMMVLSPDSAYGQRLPPSYRGDLEAIYRNACHISSLVDDILDLSQIDADRMALQREWASLSQVVEEAVVTVEALFRDRELSLQAEPPADLPDLFIDRTRIRQILINLLANAARYTHRGRVTVRAVRQGPAVILSVSDTGPGIPPEEQPYVFNEFRQVRSKLRPSGGSGLGLTVSKRFAELHGGTMWVESILGEGSTFYVRLPITNGEPVLAASHRDGWVNRVGRRVRGETERRVLVIDRSGQVREIFQRYLDGYQVIGVDDLCDREPEQDFGTGSDSIHRYASPQAVILGDSDALATWHELQRARPELSRTPVITCALRTLRSMARDINAFDYLVKPVTQAQLRSALARLDGAIECALVVDDDSEMNRLLGRMVRALNPHCQVITADDGERALELLREIRPDVMLLDLLMPSVDGYAVLRAIREDPDLRELPVLVVTAHGLHDEPTIASSLCLSREGGLSVAETMRWLSSGLEALIQPDNSAAASQRDPAG